MRACQKLNDHLFLLLETVVIFGFNAPSFRMVILRLSASPSEIDLVIHDFSRLFFDYAYVHAQIDTCTLYAHVCVLSLRLVRDCGPEESVRQMSRRMKDTRLRWPLFAQENWPRAATLAPFLGDRFMSTTTPGKAETDVPYNYHSNTVRATGLYYVGFARSHGFSIELIADFIFDCSDFHREHSIAKLRNVNMYHRILKF